MRTTQRLIASLFLTAILAAPVAIMAAPAAQDASVSVRVYDPGARQYHNWDDNENKAWGAYLVQNHRKPHDYATGSHREQSNYWKWRSSHPDSQ
jgi:hypothetical protein